MKETIKPQHEYLSWFGYKDSFSLPYSTPRVSNSRVSITSQQAPFTGGENLTRRLHKITDTKLDVELFYNGTTTPVTLCILRTKILTDHYWKCTIKWCINYKSLHNAKLTSLATLCWILVTLLWTCELLCYKRIFTQKWNVKGLDEWYECVCVNVMRSDKGKN